MAQHRGINLVGARQRIEVDFVQFGEIAFERFARAVSRSVIDLVQLMISTVVSDLCGVHRGEHWNIGDVAIGNGFEYGIVVGRQCRRVEEKYAAKNDELLHDKTR